jgi:hypothetical protein
MSSVVVEYVPLIVALVAFAGTILAASITANRGLRNYREQKDADREYDLIKRRQQEYERYLTAFGRAGRWKGNNPQKHEEAEAEYHEAHDNLLLIGSDGVIIAANAFHSQYVSRDPREWRETKRRYADLVIAMRKDGFEETELTNEEISENILRHGPNSLRPYCRTPSPL